MWFVGFERAAAAMWVGRLEVGCLKMVAAAVCAETVAGLWVERAEVGDGARFRSEAGAPDPCR